MRPGTASILMPNEGTENEWMTSGVGTSSSVNSSRNDGIAISTKIMTGTIVQTTSSGVLWVVRDGVGLARALKRIMMIRSRARTKTVIGGMTPTRNVLKPMISAIIGDAASCRPISHGVGWPSPAKAVLAPANRATTVTAIAVKRDNFIGLPSSLFLILVTTTSGSADYVRHGPQQCDAACTPRSGTGLVGRHRRDGGIPTPQTINPALLQCT